MKKNIEVILGSILGIILLIIIGGSVVFFHHYNQNVKDMSIMTDNQTSLTTYTNIAIDNNDNGRVLVWADEFEQDGLEDDNWTIMTGKFLSTSTSWRTDECVNVENGNLILSATKDNRFIDQGCDYIAGEVRSVAKHAIRNGRFECRARINNPENEYFSIWFEGQCGGWDIDNLDYEDEEGNRHYGDTEGMHWPKCGEIDLTESDYSNKMVSALHWDNLIDGHASNQFAWKEINDNEFHVYAFEKTEQSMEFFLDDELVGSADLTKYNYFDHYNPFSMPQFIILSMVTDSEHEPEMGKTVTTEIDYVRFYAPEEANKEETQPSQIAIKKYGEDESIKSLTLPVGYWQLLDGKYDVKYVTDEAFTFKSSNEDIATVYGGLIKCKKEGKTTITIHDQIRGLKSSIELNVTNEILNDVSESIDDAVFNDINNYIQVGSDALTNGYIYCEGNTEYNFSTKGNVGQRYIIMEYDDEDKLLKESELPYEETFNGYMGELKIVTEPDTVKCKIKIDGSEQGFYFTIYKLKNSLSQIELQKDDAVSANIDKISSEMVISSIEDRGREYPYYFIVYDKNAIDANYRYQAIMSTSPINSLYSDVFSTNKIYCSIKDSNYENIEFNVLYLISKDGVEWKDIREAEALKSLEITNITKDASIIEGNYRP